MYTYNGILVSLKKETDPVAGDSRMNLEDIKLSEVHQPQEDGHSQIPLTGGTEIVKLLEAEMKFRLPGAGEGGSYPDGYAVPVM